MTRPETPDRLQGGRFVSAASLFACLLAIAWASPAVAEPSEGGECAAGKALLESGEKAEAQKAYIEALKARPESECAATGVKEASEPSFWDELGTISSDAVTALGFAILLAGGLAALFLVLINILARPRLTRDWWPMSAIRRPSVSVEAFDDSGVKDKLGIGTATLLREQIELDPGSQALKLVSGEGTTEETWIGRVSEIGEQGKIAGAVAGMFFSLLPRRHVKVSGTLQPAAEPKGSGINVELHRKLASKGSEAFWASDFSLPVDDEDAATTRRLVVPAAAWVSHVVTSETGGETLGAEDSLSWALFKAGIERQREGDLGTAASIYQEALARDPSNYGAATNLGLIEAGVGLYARAIPRLRQALFTLEIG